MKDWDFAELSKKAKLAGGPEKFVEKLVSAARAEGRASMWGWLVGVAAGATLIGFGIKRLIDFLKKKMTASRKELEQAKAELIRGIKEYDEAFYSANKKDDSADQNAVI